MEDKVNRVVMPGDVLGEIDPTSKEKEKIKLGPGLRQENGQVFACKAGILRSKKPKIFWIDSNQKRYVAVKGDSVIGIIAKTGADNYRVDIGTSIPAALGNLSFDGATKRNRPNLQIGDIVYAKLSLANKDMEPELTCIDSSGKANGLGQLSGGFLIVVSIGLARKLLRSDYLVLHLLGKHFPFEVTVGLNGRVWIKSNGILNTVAIANAITKSEYASDEQIKKIVNEVMKELQGF
eukprot:gene8250-9132_t